MTSLFEAAVRLVRVLVPANGALLVLAESYFDETNTHGSGDRLCIGGYVFLKDAAEKQAMEWAALLERWKLPYFHMVECAHNTKKFSHLSADECDQAARQAIAIIKDTASAGITMTVDVAEYDAIIPPYSFFGGAYDSCARDVISGVADWIDRSKFDGTMLYFFEDGVESSGNAGFSIATMMQDPETRAEARYGGHSFVPKVQSPGVQAADILAWHAGQDCKRAMKGKPRRKDFESLCEIPHSVVHINRRILEEKAAVIPATP